MTKTDNKKRCIHKHHSSTLLWIGTETASSQQAHWNFWELFIVYNSICFMVRVTITRKSNKQLKKDNNKTGLMLCIVSLNTSWVWSWNLMFIETPNKSYKKRRWCIAQTEEHLSAYVQQCTAKGEVMAYVAVVAGFINLFVSRLSSHLVDTLFVSSVNHISLYDSSCECSYLLTNKRLTLQKQKLLST
jgi:hypothetical protein